LPALPLVSFAAVPSTLCARPLPRSGFASLRRLAPPPLVVAARDAVAAPTARPGRAPPRVKAPGWP